MTVLHTGCWEGLYKTQFTVCFSFNGSMEHVSLIMLLLMSTHIYAGNIPKPKAVLTANPWPQIFLGEALIFRCRIQGKEVYNWKYNCVINNRQVIPSLKKSVFIIRSFKKKRITCTCVGVSMKTKQTSAPSEAITMTAMKRPKAVLHVFPAWWLNVGGSVNLSCVVEPLSPGWQFFWYKKDKSNTAQRLSDSNRGVGGTYSLRPVGQNHIGEYLCRGARGKHVYETELSESQFLWVADPSQPAFLIVTPDRSQHFNSESVSVNCQVQENSKGWRLKRYTNNEGMSDLSSDIGSLTGYLHDSGMYWCESESGEHSNSVNITVLDSDLILESPALPVTEGDSVTMRCRYKKTPLNFSADFYKGGSLVRDETTGEMTIAAVSKLDEGLYKCTHPGKRESPASWLPVRGIGPRPSKQVTLWLTVGLSIIFVFVLLLCCKFKLVSFPASNQDRITSQNQIPMHTVETIASEVIYAEIKHRTKPKIEKPVQSDTIYSPVNTGSGTR